MDTLIGKRVMLNPSFNHGASYGTVLEYDGSGGIACIYKVRLDNGVVRSYADCNFRVVEWE